VNLIKKIEYKTKKMIKKKENDDKGLGLASGPQHLVHKYIASQARTPSFFIIIIKRVDDIHFLF
jgi:hypothetical protein